MVVGGIAQVDPEHARRRRAHHFRLGLDHRIVPGQQLQTRHGPPLLLAAFQHLRRVMLYLLPIPGALDYAYCVGRTRKQVLGPRRTEETPAPAEQPWQRVRVGHQSCRACHPGLYFTAISNTGKLPCFLKFLW